RREHPNRGRGSYVRPQPLSAVEGDPQPIRVERRCRLRTDERIDVHVAIRVLLARYRGAVDITVTGGPDRHGVGLRLSTSPPRLHLDLNPGAGRRVRVP